MRVAFDPAPGAEAFGFDISDDLAMRYVGRLATLYAAYERVSPALLSEWATGDRDVLGKIVSRNPFTPYADILHAFQWFSENWPANYCWPANVPRPVAVKGGV